MTLYRSDPLRKQVYDYLREQMVSGRLKAGDFINQAELISRLGVSRTPLRDSLMQLEAEGFVSIIPCRGVQIRPLTRDAIRNIYQISGALEAAAFEQAFPGMEQERLDELVELVAETEVRMSQGDFEACSGNNQLFHEKILELCDNEELLKMLRCSRERLYRFPGGATRDFSAAEDLASWEKEYWEQHRKIIDIFRTGTARELGDYMRYVHWDFEGAEDRIAAFYGLDDADGYSRK